MDESVQKHLEQPARLEEWQRVLLKAADIMERDGFAQGCLERHGKLCLVGAILKASGGNPADPWDGRSHPLTNWVLRIAEKVHPKMAQWNDTPGRTGEEVIARMRAAALGG